MQISKVCIVGMGTMGSQIGIVSAGGGYKSSMVDTSEEKVAAGLKSVHFFLETSDTAHDTIVDFLEKCGKQTVTVTDSPGFLINCLYLPMVN